LDSDTAENFEEGEIEDHEFAEEILGDFTEHDNVIHIYGPHEGDSHIEDEDGQIIELKTITVSFGPTFDNREKFCSYLSGSIVQFLEDQDTPIYNTLLEGLRGVKDEKVLKDLISKIPENMPDSSFFFIYQQNEKGYWGGITIPGDLTADNIILVNLELEDMEVAWANIRIGYLVVTNTSIEYFNLDPDASTEGKSMNIYFHTEMKGLGVSDGGKEHSATKEEVLVITKDDPETLETLGDARKNKEIVMAAVTQDGYALEYADESFKKDKDVVMAAVTQNGYALKYADESFKKDKDVVMAAVTYDHSTLQYADRSLKRDKEFVMAAVTQNGYALEYADESLTKDKDVVIAAVTQDGRALFRGADESLTKDKDVVIAAVTQNGYVLESVDKSLRKDKDVVMAAVTQNGYALEYADKSLRKDPDILAACKK
jgi:Domain of unknown function (DUF4116)